MEDFHWIHRVLLKADILLPLLPFLPRSLRPVSDGRSDPPALLFHQRLLELSRSVGDVQTGVRAGDGGGVLPGKHGRDHKPPHLPILDGVAVLVLGRLDLFQEPRLVRLELPRIPLLLALVGDVDEERLKLLARPERIKLKFSVKVSVLSVKLFISQCTYFADSTLNI